MQPGTSALIGNSPIMIRLRAQIERVAEGPLSVLIEGPTGAGKELVAIALHQMSRRAGALVAVNVCAIPETMFDDAMFGHARGAFTGAITDSPGHAVEANGGTLFLDEISSLPLSLQSKLLRMAETKQFRPVGARQDRRSDFRLVAATNQSLSALVDEGRFRSDLQHRLSALILRVPPLRDRLEDVPELAGFLSKQFARSGGRLARLSDDALLALADYDWPGNVRELRAVIEGTTTMSDSSIVTAHDVQAHLRERRLMRVGSASRDAERDEMLRLLERHLGDTSELARALGIDRATVYRRLRSLGIPTPRQRRGRESDDLLSRAMETQALRP